MSFIMDIIPYILREIMTAKNIHLKKNAPLSLDYGLDFYAPQTAFFQMEEE